MKTPDEYEDGLHEAMGRLSEHEDPETIAKGANWFIAFLEKLGIANEDAAQKAREAVMRGLPEPNDNETEKPE